MGLKDLTLKTTGTILLVAAATHYIGFGLTRTPENRPANLETVRINYAGIKYTGKLDNGKEFTFIPNKDGELINLEDERNAELSKARAEYDSKKSMLDTKYSGLQSKLRNFEYK